MSLPSAKKPLFLSASRIDTFQTCSQLYAAKYLLKLPDSGNDGSRRGSTVHDVLELLAVPRHRPLYDAAMKAKTCTKVPALWRLIERLARKHGVTKVMTATSRLTLGGNPIVLDANLLMIDDFIMVGLKHEFHGPEGTFESEAERSFELEINEGGKHYAIRGFIDRLFKVRGEQCISLIIRDFKSSKAKMQGDKETFNYQSLIYQLAAKKLFPDIAARDFHFLFLRFPRKPIQEQPSFTDGQLNGFEWHLTDLQVAVESFDLTKASSNLAVKDEEKRWLCGREGVKKDGTTAWICGARNPLDYWTVVTSEGEIVESAFTDAELTRPLPPGCRVEIRRYNGCPAFWTAAGKRRNLV